MIWSIEKIHLPLKFDWKISRNTSAFKTNFIVRVDSDGLVGEGEVAFNVRYGESELETEQSFERFKLGVSELPTASVEGFGAALNQLELPKSLQFAIESAFVHFKTAQAKSSVWKVLGLPSPEAKIPTSFSLPILEVNQIAGFIREHQLNRFPVLKIKVDSQAIERVREVSRNFDGPLRVDANEAWNTAEEVLNFIEEARDLPLEFIEQPLPAHLVEESRELKKYSKVTLVADEAVTSGDVTADYVKSYDAINIKLMKSGGYLQAAKQLKQARELGLKTMLGCMVETSIGISSAMCVGGGVDYFDLDGFLLIKDEPYGWITEDSGYLSFSDGSGSQLFSNGLKPA